MSVEIGIDFNDSNVFYHFTPILSYDWKLEYYPLNTKVSFDKFNCRKFGYCKRIKKLLGKQFYEQEVQEYINTIPYKIINDINSGKAVIEIETENGEKKNILPEEIASIIFKNLDTELRLIRCNYNIEDYNIIITVPIYFNEIQRKSLISVMELNGILVSKIIEEPIAALIAYDIEKINYKGKNLVVSLNYFQLDITLLEMNESKIMIIGNKIIKEISGKKLIDKIIEYCKIGNDIDNNLKQITRLEEECEKELTKFNKEFNLEIDDEDITIDKITLKIIFKEICIDNFLIEFLKDNNLTESEIDNIILAGEYPIDCLLYNSENPKILNKYKYDTYCIGAAKAANFYEMIVLDLGIEIINGINDIIIFKNRSIPFREERYYRSCFENESLVLIKVYEGRQQFVQDNHFVDEILFNLSNKRCGKKLIKIIFDMDNYYNLTISVKEEGNNDNSITHFIKQEKFIKKYKSEYEYENRKKEISDILNKNLIKKNAIERIILNKICPNSIGIKKEDDLLDKIIERGTFIPCKKSKIYSTLFDNQDSFSINIYEGERYIAEDNNYVDELILNNLSKKPKGEVKIEITMELNDNYILTISAKEIGTNNYVSYKIIYYIDNKKKINDFELKDINRYNIICKIKNKLNEINQNEDKDLEEEIKSINEKMSLSKNEYNLEIWEEINEIINNCINKIKDKKITLLEQKLKDTNNKLHRAENERKELYKKINGINLKYEKEIKKNQIEYQNEIQKLKKQINKK